MGFVGDQKEVPISNSTVGSRIDPVRGIKSGSSRGFRLPPPAKFRSGHLPVNATSGEVDDSASNSDNDGSSDSEVYGGRYSLDSSPQDNRIPNGGAQRYGNLTYRGPGYGSASDYTYSEVSSSRETVFGRPGVVRDPLVGRAGNVKQKGFTEDESSDSAASSEFSTTHGGSVNGAVPTFQSHVSEGYASSVPSRMKQNAAQKVCNG